MEMDVAEVEAVAPDAAGGGWPSTETKEWNQLKIQCAVNPMFETMQLTEPVVVSQDTMGSLVQVEEQRVDEATDMKEVEVRV